MTVRDLGYRAYEGELLPASHNTWVLLRYGLWRIWGSWINKAVVFTAILPMLGLVGAVGLRFLVYGRDLPVLEQPRSFVDALLLFMLPPEPAAMLRLLTGIQFWFFVTVLTLRSGSGVIAEDFTHKAYQFYFAKPVTPVQYLVGRASALAIYVFAVLFVPSVILVFMLAGLGPEDQILERLGLSLPAILDALIIATSCSILAVAVSAISKSRSLTMMAWGGILFVPTVLAMLVHGIAQTDWMWVGSVPGLVWVIGDALYKTGEHWDELSWFYAAPVLAALVVGGVYLALHRIRQAEVIT